MREVNALEAPTREGHGSFPCETTDSPRGPNLSLFDRASRCRLHNVPTTGEHSGGFTMAPSLVQGLDEFSMRLHALGHLDLVEYALIDYYRCIGSIGQHLGGPRCTNRPVRQISWISS